MHIPQLALSLHSWHPVLHPWTMKREAGSQVSRNQFGTWRSLFDSLNSLPAQPLNTTHECCSSPASLTSNPMIENSYFLGVGHISLVL